MLESREGSEAIALIHHAHLSLCCQAKYANTIADPESFIMGIQLYQYFFFLLFFLF